MEGADESSMDATMVIRAKLIQNQRSLYHASNSHECFLNNKYGDP